MSTLGIENLNGNIPNLDFNREIMDAPSRDLTRDTESQIAGQGKTFSDVLRQSVDKVNEFQSQADTAIKELVAGKNKNIHETLLAVERADISLKLMMQVRNKIVDAYKEIMRMQV